MDEPTKLLELPPINRMQRLAGSGIALLALGYFLYSMAGSFGNEQFRRVLLDAPQIGLLAVAAFMVFNLLGAIGWVLLLRTLGASTPVLSLMAAFLTTVIAKYLPGNVGHFIGRGAIAKTLGVSVTRSAASFVLESGVLATVAAVVALIGLGPAYMKQHELPLEEIIALAAIGFALLFFASEYPRRRGASLPKRLPMAAGIAATAAIDLACFLLLGLLVRAALPQLSVSLWEATGAFALAFVAGFIIPGAPAGAGVREAVFIGIVPLEIKPAATALILLLRIAQLAADGLTFLFGYGLHRSYRRRESASTGP